MSTSEFLQKIQSKKVLILGDVMVDAYYSGHVDRISPEAPVPIVRVETRDNRLGGAANVALNIKAMGAEPIICAVVGQDAKGEELMELLVKRGLSIEGIITSTNRPTTVKTRILSENQQILRVDEESTVGLNKEETQNFLDVFNGIIRDQKIEAVIYEDYNKGLLTEEIIKETLTVCKANNLLTTVDPKKDNFLSYQGCGLFKPNLKEVREGLKLDLLDINIDALDDAAKILKSKLNHQYTMITLSELGAYSEEGGKSLIIDAHTRKIVDVSGAGDTVISVATLFLLAGAPIELATKYANLAGGMVCEKVGVVPIDKQELIEEASITGIDE